MLAYEVALYQSFQVFECISDYRCFLCFVSSFFWMAKGMKHSVSNFKREWSILCPCIQPSKDHPYRIPCMVCNSSFGIAHQEKCDVQRHLEGSDHKRLPALVRHYRHLFLIQHHKGRLLMLKFCLMLLYWNIIYLLKEQPMQGIYFILCSQIVK